MSSHSQNIEYHLRELQIARDPTSTHYIIPDIGDRDKYILDIGCGIGQTLLVLSEREERHDRRLVGVDIDQECLQYGREKFDNIEFALADAEKLPFDDSAFDFVISRVALPLTALRESLPEIGRVVADGGHIWLTLHPISMTIKHLWHSLSHIRVKDAVFRLYVLTNGATLHWFGKEFRFPINGRCESFQTRRGMRRLLERDGFTDISFQLTESLFVCTAQKTSSRLQISHESGKLV